MGFSQHKICSCMFTECRNQIALSHVGASCRIHGHAAKIVLYLNGSIESSNLITDPLQCLFFEQCTEVTFGRRMRWFGSCKGF